MVYHEISYFLKTIDIFGQGIELRIGKDIKSKTNIGGILSILMFGLLMSMFILNFSNLINRTNPLISVEQQVSQEYPMMILDQETFPFSISLTYNGNLAIYKPEYFKYSVTRKSGLTTADEFNTTEYNLVNCKKSFFPRISQEMYKSLNMDQNLCIDNQNMTISGSWSKDQITYLVLKISLCTGSPNCAPYNEITDFLKNSTLFWNIYFQNTDINPQDFKKPVKYTLANFYKMINMNSYKIIEFYMRPQSLESDEGLFYQTYNTDYSIAYDYDIFDEGTYDSFNTLVEFNIMVSKNTYIYHRSYTKIQNVLASVGGMATLMRALFITICYIFSITKRDEVILNKIFEFDLKDAANDYRKRSRKSFIRKLHEIKHDRQRELQEIEEENNKELNIKFKLNESEFTRQKPTQSTVGGSSNQLLIRNGSIDKDFNKQLTSQPLKKGRDSKATDKEQIIKEEEDEEIKLKKLERSKLPSSLQKKVLRPSFSIAIQKTIAERIRKKAALLQEQQISSNKKNSGLSPVSPDKNFLASNNLVTSAALEINPNESSKKRKVSEAREVLDMLETKTKKRKLKFTFGETIVAFLCPPCCMKSSLITKKKLYNKSNFVIEEFLDITYIIHKLEEFEKFKIVLLKSEQLALFNFISKELISLDGEKTKNHFMTHLKAMNKDKEHLANIILKYRNKVKSNEGNNIDKKLFNLLDEDFK